MHIAVCDDEPATLAYLSELVRRWGEGRTDPVRVERFPSAQALWFEWEAKPRFDLFLLDIQMQGLDGVTLARKIRAADEKCAIIFITGTAEFAADGYDVSALHYLLKPIDEAKLFACLDKAAARLSRAPKQLLLPVAGVQTRFCADDIFYAEAFAHSVCIHTADGAQEVQVSIGELEKTLAGEPFVRCHRSYLVSLRQIRRIDKSELTLDSRERLPVSRRLYAAVNNAFIRFFKGE
jgi:DNA-binding LytR/AlgR family response regulator